MFTWIYMDYIWTGNISWNNDTSLDLPTWFHIHFQCVFINEREPSQCCIFPVLQNKWNAWFSPDLDFINITAKSFSSLQNVWKLEKCISNSRDFWDAQAETFLKWQVTASYSKFSGTNPFTVSKLYETHWECVSRLRSDLVEPLKDLSAISSCVNNFHDSWKDWLISLLFLLSLCSDVCWFWKTHINSPRNSNICGLRSSDSTFLNAIKSRMATLYHYYRFP